MISCREIIKNLFEKNQELHQILENISDQAEVLNNPSNENKQKQSTTTQSTMSKTEDNELFLFEDEVEPILSVLCGKTLEIARMEVL